MIVTPIAALLAAEDVHVSNLLALTNTTTRHFDQYAWGEAGQFRRGLHNIVPGIEGPRTAHLGHTISLNIGKPLDNSLDYFHYHKAFEAYAEQGALSGFAHVGLGEFYEWRGLALEVPFGTVDFVEVMQFSALHTEIWYNFLCNATFISSLHDLGRGLLGHSGFFDLVESITFDSKRKTVELRIEGK